MAMRKSAAGFLNTQEPSWLTVTGSKLRKRSGAQRSHALKAVGEQRGWVHDRHPNIFDIGEHQRREFDRAEEFDRYLVRT